MLSLPDVRKARDCDCGGAAVRCVAAFFGVRPHPSAEIANDVQGMAPDTLAACLRASGLRVLAGEMLGGVEDLRYHTRAGRPVVCPITVEGGGHWVVVAGVSRGRVRYHCTTFGPSSMPVGEWLSRWRDTSAETLHPFDRWGIVSAPASGQG